MQRSSNRNPCPCCGRTKTAHCAWKLDGTEEDTILCHVGERWGPPAGLNIGDVIDLAGRDWALTATGKGFAGTSHVFRPHRGRSEIGYRLPASIRRGNASLLSVEPLHKQGPSALWKQLYRDAKVAFDPSVHLGDRLDTISSLADRCKQLLVQLRRGVKADHTLQPHVDEATSLLRLLRYERQHLSKCATNASYEAALGGCAPTDFELEESDWSYWRRQKALPSHPWVVECRLAGTQFWFPVEEQL